MIRISEYWILWAARLEVEIARAWQRGDPPPHLTSGFSGVDFTHW